MLNEEVELFTKLSGRDGQNTPVGIIGAYLDGYEKGKADAIAIDFIKHQIEICDEIPAPFCARVLRQLIENWSANDGQMTSK